MWRRRSTSTVSGAACKINGGVVGLKPRTQHHRGRDSSNHCIPPPGCEIAITKSPAQRSRSVTPVAAVMHRQRLMPDRMLPSLLENSGAGRLVSTNAGAGVVTVIEKHDIEPRLIGCRLVLEIQTMIAVTDKAGATQVLPEHLYAAVTISDVERAKL